jgi:hypothetical protein
MLHIAILILPLGYIWLLMKKVMAFNIKWYPECTLQQHVNLRYEKFCEIASSLTVAVCCVDIL